MVFVCRFSHSTTYIDEGRGEAVGVRPRRRLPVDAHAGGRNRAKCVAVAAHGEAADDVVVASWGGEGGESGWRESIDVVLACGCGDETRHTAADADEEEEEEGVGEAQHDEVQHLGTG